MKNKIYKIKLILKSKKIIIVFFVMLGIIGLLKILPIITKNNVAVANTCQDYDFYGPPPAPTNLVADYVYGYDNSMVKVTLKWSSPDLMGYLAGQNDCMEAKNGWDSDTSKLPLSDFKYIVTADDGTNVVIENNYFGVSSFNSGGYLKQTFAASDKIVTKKYSVYTYRNSDGTIPIVSSPSEITVKIYPQESVGCTLQQNSDGTSASAKNCDTSKIQ